MSTLKVDTYLTRGGASEIAIDKLKGVTAAGSMLVVAEGGTNTTNLQQGLTKSWLTMDGTGTVGIVDSFNIGGITDEGTAEYSFTYSTNMGTAKHPVTGSVIGSLDSNFYAFVSSTGVAQATTGDRFHIVHHSGAFPDIDPIHIVVHGDLA